MSVLRLSRWWMLLPAAAGLWLLWFAPAQAAGIDTGIAGSILLSLAAWGAVALTASAPRDTAAAMSPGETQAWIAFAFTLLIAAYLLRATDLLLAGDWLGDPLARRFGWRMAILVVAWVVVSAVVRMRTRGVEEDERDRAIQAIGISFAYGAVALSLIGYAVTLGLSPPERLAWVTPPAVANQMIFILLWGSIVDNAARGIAYWRDRR